MTPRLEALSSVRGLVHGILWNAVGRCLPILVALAATPVLLHRLGLERWGLFTLALSVAGSFGILDFGIGAALTRALAERIGTPEEAEAPALVVTSLTMLTLTSLVGAAGLFACVPWFLDRVLHVPADLLPEATLAFEALAASGPLIVLSASLWGILAAYQRFRVVNLVNIPISAMYYAGPLLVLLVRDSLVGVILALAAVRLAQTAICLLLALRLIPALRHRPRIELRLLRDLLRIGAWVTVSNTLAPLMIYVDRFLVGATASLTAVSYYVTPVDLVWRLTILPFAIGTTLFPAVATSHARMPERLRALTRTSLLTIVVLVFPACVTIVGFGHELMALWLGAEFAAKSDTVLVIVGVGVFFSCIAVPPGTVLDGVGRPEVGAIFLIGQALLFPPAVVALTVFYGIEGAAAAWTVRAVVNWVGRSYMCGRLRPSLRPVVNRLLGLGVAGGGALVLCASIGPLPLRLPAMALAALGVPLLAAATLLERHEIAGLLQAVRRTGARLPWGASPRRN